MLTLNYRWTAALWMPPIAASARRADGRGRRICCRAAAVGRSAAQRPASSGLVGDAVRDRVCGNERESFSTVFSPATLSQTTGNIDTRQAGGTLARGLAVLPFVVAPCGPNL